MKKLLLASSALSLAIASTAHATELNPDPGMDNAGLHMQMGDTPRPTISSGKLHFTGNTSDVSMTMDMLTVPVKLWHRYRVTWDQTNWSHGSTQIVLAKPMMGTPSGGTINTVDLNGLAPIASNFDRTQGLDTKAPDTPGTIVPTSLSAFRIFWSAGPINSNDPVVYNGQQGVSHPHQFICNTWTPYHPEADYATARAHGGTTCGNIIDERYPLNRSSYWFPTLVNIKKGYFVRPHGNLYYKRWPAVSARCKSYPSNLGQCIAAPRGLRMIMGWDFAAHAMPSYEAFSWTGGDYAGPDMQTAINAAYTKNGMGSALLLSLDFNTCWDGVHLDVPNHRSHVVNAHYGDGEQCPDDHPYTIPLISLQIFYNINQDALNGEWRLTSDSMDHGATPGSTAHMDYFEAWDPTTRDEMRDNCLDPFVSASDGDLCDGHAIKDGDKLLDSNNQSVPDLSLWKPKSNITPVSVAGYSAGCVGNKTCTAEIVANANGTLMVMSQDGAIADVDNVHVVEITTAH